MVVDRVLRALRAGTSAVRPELVRLMWEAGLLRADSPQVLARALPHLAARGPHLGLAFLLHAHAHGGRRALADRAGALDWRELNDRTNRIGRGLRRRGAQPGERVALMLPAGRELVECLGACQKAAVRAVAMDPQLTAAQAAEVLSRHPPRVLVYHTRCAGLLREAMERGGRPPSLIAAGAGPLLEGSAAYEEVVAGAERHEFRPRPVPQPPVTLCEPGPGGEVSCFERDTVRGMSTALGFLRVVPLRHSDVFLLAAPPVSGGGFGVLALALALGATSLLLEDLRPQELLQVTHDEQVTVIALTPGVLGDLLSLPDDAWHGFDRSRLQAVLSVGRGRIPPEVRKRAMNRLGPVIHELFWTPQAGWIAVTRPEDYERKPSSVGRPLPGLTLTVRDASGRRLPPGVPGELFVAADAGPGETPAGARGWVDDEGYLFVES